MFAVHLVPWARMRRRRSRRWPPTRPSWRSPSAPGKAIYFSSSPRWRQYLFGARQSRRSGHRSADAPSRPAHRTLPKHHRHHRGGRQEAGRRSARPRPALRWRPVGVALERRRKNLVRRGRPSTTSPAPPPKACTRWPPTEKGTLFAAWLDKRGAKGTKLYAARSMDDGATWSKNIDGLSIARRLASANAATPRWRSTPPASCW